MSVFYTDASEAVAIVAAAFPDYQHTKGRLSVMPFRKVTPSSCWNGGTRDFWAFVRLADLKASPVIPENGTGYTPDVGAIEALPAGFALVRRTIGSFKAAEIMVNPENMTGMLPKAMELSADEDVVLACTKGLKSFARLEYSARKWGSYSVTSEHKARWEAAKATLINKGLLNRAGAITTDGRNLAKRYESLPGGIGY